VSHKGARRFTRDSGEPFAHMVMRDRFDALLLEQARKAGAEFRAGTTIRDVSTDGAVTVRAEGFEAKADYLLCADGAHSPVGKMVGLGEGISECAAWEVEVRAPAMRTRDYRGKALIELGYKPWGYAWVFPKAKVLSIGIVLPPGQAGSMKEHVRAYIESLGLAGAEVEIARGHKIRFRRGNEPIGGERALLLGDSAGLADEFTEEGISYAVESGRLAARNVLRGLGGGAITGYQRDVDREIMPELKAARRISYMFYGMLRRAPAPWMFASAHFSLLWDAFFAVQRGESTYAREAGRIPLLPGLAQRMLDRQ